MRRTALNRVLKQVWPDAASERSDPDRELLRRFTAGSDQEAFATLVRRHGGLVSAACRQVLGDAPEADDAFQATFLILLRQAKRVNWSESLASWLYVVAHRVAVRARAQAKTRRTKEAATIPKSPESESDLSWREACAILHDELDKLPRHYRAALLLCYLEGQSRDEAARNLGCSLDAVKGNLERGRRMLAKRLTRRGITLSAGLLAAAATKDSNAAPLDAAIEATLRAAAGTVSRSVGSLVAEVATHSRFGRRLVVGVLLLCGVLGAAPLLGLPHNPDDKPAPPSKAETPAPKAEAANAPPKIEVAKKHPDIESTIAGQVVDPDNKPVAGGKVYWIELGDAKSKPEPRGTTGPDGRFSFRVRHPYIEQRAPKRQTASEFGFATVAAEGYGVGWAWVFDAEKLANQRIIVTPDTIPVRGRIIGLQGQPIVGAIVAVSDVRPPEDWKDLTPWMDWTRNPTSELSAGWLRELYQHSGPLMRSGVFPSAVTDNEGRFELRGIGRERVATLSIEGDRIESMAVHCVTRDVATFTLRERGRTTTYHGSRVDLVAPPSAPIEGVVKDKDTGAGLAGAKIKLSDETVLTLGRPVPRHIEFVSDRNGKYRITGCPVSGTSSATFNVTAPPGSAYPNRQFDVTPSTTPAQPVAFDIELKRGVVLTVKVLDKRTRAPVRAECRYLPLKGNPHLDAFPDIDLAKCSYQEDEPAQIAVVPGRGVIAVRAFADRYLRGVVPATLADGKGRRGGTNVSSGIGGERFGTGFENFEVNSYNALAEVKIAPEAKSAEVTVELDPGPSVSGVVLDNEGKGVTGCVFLGLETHGRYFGEVPAVTDKFEALSLRTGEKRRVIAFHEDRKLAGSVVVSAGQKEPAVIRLEPWGEVIGRLVDEAGRPVKEGWTMATSDKACYEDLTQGASPLCPTRNAHEVGPDGRFRLTGLVPGLKHQFVLLREVYGEEGPEVTIMPVVKPGEVKDLGDIVVKKPEPEVKKKDDD